MVFAYDAGFAIGSILADLIFYFILGSIIYLIWEYVIKYPKMASYSKRQRISLKLIFILIPWVGFGIVPSVMHGMNEQNQMVTITPYTPKYNQTVVSVNIPLANVTTDPIYVKPITVSPSK